MVSHGQPNDINDVDPTIFTDFWGSKATYPLVMSK